MIWLSTDDHHRPRAPVRVAAVPQPGEAVRHPYLPDNTLPSRGQWPRGATAPHAEGRHHVPCSRAVDRSPSTGPSWHTTSYKEDLQSSAAELVYGEPLWVPGEFLVPATPKVEASIFIQELRHHMDQLRPTPAARHASPATFIHKDLLDSTHVFLRQDAVHRALDPPYSGPHKIIARSDKIQTFRARPAGHCLNRPSQARLRTGRNPARHRQPTSPALQYFNKTCRNTNSTTQDYTFRARCTLPGSFHSLNSILRRGVGWKHPHIISIQYSVSHHNSEHPSIH